MHSFSGTVAPLTVQVGPLRPHVFIPELTYRGQSGQTLIDGEEQDDGTVLFAVSRERVQAIIANAAYLFLVTSHTRQVGAPGDWGWRYRLLQDGGPLAG